MSSSFQFLKKKILKKNSSKLPASTRPSNPKKTKKLHGWDLGYDCGQDGNGNQDMDRTGVEYDTIQLIWRDARNVNLTLLFNLNMLCYV